MLYSFNLYNIFARRTEHVKGVLAQLRLVHISYTLDPIPVDLSPPAAAAAFPAAASPAAPHCFTKK